MAIGHRPLVELCMSKQLTTIVLLGSPFLSLVVFVALVRSLSLSSSSSSSLPRSSAMSSMPPPSTEQELQKQLEAARQHINQLNYDHQQTVVQAQAEIASLRQQQQQQAALAVSSSPSLSSPSPSSGAGGAFTPSRVDLKPMQPTPFHGTANGNAEQWLTELERYFLVAGLDERDPRRSALASTYLKDTASVWYTSTVKDPTFGATPSWAVFRERFLSHFQPLAASRMARAAIRNLRHRHKVAGYSQEFQRQMLLIPDMSVADQIEFYISGLQGHIAQEVDRAMPKSLSEAMEVAQRVELMLATRRGGRPTFGRPFIPYHRGGGEYNGHAGGDHGDRMDLSALGGDQPDFDYGGEDYSPNEAAYLNAMFQRGRGGGPRPSSRGGRGGHISVPGLSRADFDKLSKEGKCFHCRESGHLARNCPKAQKSKN